MKMRRLVVEVLVPADEYPSDVRVISAIEGGIMDCMIGDRFDVMVLRAGTLVEFNAGQWGRLKETRA